MTRDEIVQRIADKLGIKAPKSEQIEKEMAMLDDIQELVQNSNPKVLLGAIYFIAKGVPVLEAKKRAERAEENYVELAKGLSTADTGVSISV